MAGERTRSVRTRGAGGAPMGPVPGEPGVRLGILGVAVVSLLTVLLARLTYLQLVAPGRGEDTSAAYRQRVLTMEAPRGRVLDARGRVLVENRTALVVTAQRQALDRLGAGGRADLLVRLADRLTRAGIAATASDLEDRLGDPEYGPLQPVPLAVDVPEDLLVLLAERAEEFPGVTVHRQAVRRYPHGPLAAHILGYVGRITPEEADRAEVHGPDAAVGRTGLEATFDADLRGTPGRRTVEVDRRGRIVRVVDDRPPVPGHDVQLTVDLEVQRLVEARLAGQIESLRGRTGVRGSNDAALAGRAGAVVVLDPRTGSVVALASSPTYDPTEFVNGISTAAYRRLTGDGDPAANALINRAVSGQYAPGSTFKLVSAHAALASGLITPSSRYDDRGSYLVGDSRRRNAEGVSNGLIDVTRALSASSDVFFYWIGDRLWKERHRFGEAIQETARRYGLGARTGIELPAEAAGVVPDPAWKRRLFEAMPPDQQARGDGRWYGGDSANLAIGQGDLLVTPLQLASAYATFAAGGVRRQPNLVHRVLSPGADGAVTDLPACHPTPPGTAAGSPCTLRVTSPVETGRLTIAEATRDALQAGLAGVTTSPGGTATVAFAGFDQAAYPILAKTGTVEAGHGRADHAAFVAVGPAPEPRHVVAAYLEHAGFGSEAAAPVVRSVLELLSGQQADPCAPAGRPPVPCARPRAGTGHAGGTLGKGGR